VRRPAEEDEDVVAYKWKLGSREGTPYPLARVLSPFQRDTPGFLGYGTTSGVVAPGVEHAGDSVRLPGP